MKRSTSHKVALCRAASSQHPGTVLPKFRVCCLCSESAPILHCAKQHRKGVAAEGKILFLEPGFMVGSVLLSRLHCSTGWHKSWGDIHVPTPPPRLWRTAWTKWCFLVLLKTLFVKYVEKSIPVWGNQDSHCLNSLFKDSIPREVELWFQSRYSNSQDLATSSNYHFL